MSKLPISFPTLVPKGNSLDDLKLLFQDVVRNFQIIAGANNNPDNGPSTARPKQQLVAGQLFFDKTLTKPIWWTGTVWVDATGTPV